MTYLITFSCYGKRLHGNKTGSVDKRHKQPGSPLVEADQRYLKTSQSAMREPLYTLSTARRERVLQAIKEVCRHRAWLLMAAHVRTDHVHVVLDAPTKPEIVMRDLKTYASRSLAETEPRRIKRWTRHGSTRYLWTPKQIANAMSYVVSGQGEPMALYHR